ncbi:MAG TPA: hypothetical protein VKM55_10610 [Candidatus Lokiarchaeia archaeon]|nr:hypothetical protein [Candidatus Lokiarchaeia archaeon]
MPYRMTRPEVAKRLAIKAMADATPGITYRDLARLFRTSYSAVRDALRSTVAKWAAMLIIAPEPSIKVGARLAVQRVTPIPTRPGKRENVCLEKPEPTINIPEPVEFDEEEVVIDQAAIDRDTNDKIDEQDWKVRHGLIGNEETAV